jgi:hypothetical protein
MAERHTALLDIPRLVAAEGVRVVELSGWETWKPDYFWTDPNGNHYRYKGKPNGAIWHHTATEEYTPHVTANGKTKANIYVGLSVNGSERLYSQKAYWDIGVPTVAFACAGPANYGNGAGYRKVLTDYVARDREVPGPHRRRRRRQPAASRRVGSRRRHPRCDDSTLWMDPSTEHRTRGLDPAQG